MNCDKVTAGRTTCILCGELAQPFFEIPSVPVNISQLYEDAASAAAALTGRIAMASCPSCGGFFNAAWDPALISYDGHYENSLDASPVFGEYAVSLAHRLSAARPSNGLPIIEIGCGQARFLRAISEISGCEGLGFDPSYVGPETAGRVTVKTRLCQPQDTASAGMVICRHVLEHLGQPREFIRSLALVAQASPETRYYFEVPNAELIFGGSIPWDIIYPHVSYFTAQSLTALFSGCGFHVLNTGTAFGGQFLYIEAQGTGTAEGRVPAALAPSPAINQFPTVLSSAREAWARTIKGFRADGASVAFWGAGAKGVTFLNTVPDARDIDCVVDLNPRKQGTFVPGTGQRISSPESLVRFRPDVIITPNPIYEAEIRTRLEGMSCTALVVTGIESAADAAESLSLSAANFL